MASERSSEGIEQLNALTQAAAAAKDNPRPGASISVRDLTVTYNNGFTNILKKVTVGDKKAKALQNYVELNLAIFF